MFWSICCLLCVMIASSVTCCAVEDRRTSTNHKLAEKTREALRKGGGVLANVAELDWGAKQAADVDGATVIRPVIGGTFSLTCLVLVVDEAGLNETGHHWNHNGMPLPIPPHGSHIFTPPLCAGCDTCRCGRSNSTRYQPSLSVTSYTLQTVQLTNRTLHTVLMRDATQWHAGRYECMYDGTVTAHYLVAPQYTPRDVFIPPMEDVTVQVKYSAQLHCYTQFDVLPSSEPFDKRFIWLLDDHVLYAPIGHPLRQRRTPTSVLGFGYTTSWDVNPFDTCTCRSTLRIDRVLAQSVGRIRCLFKVDSFLNEWMVQTVNLSVRFQD